MILTSSPLIFLIFFFFFNDTATTKIYTLSLHDALPILLLFFNYSTTVNWRYFLTGLPAIVPLGAFWFLRLGERRFGNVQRAFVACCGAIVLMAAVLFIYMRPISFEFIQRRAMSREYKHRLAQVPPDAVLISGAQTIAVHYWAALGGGAWKASGTGGGCAGHRV